MQTLLSVRSKVLKPCVTRDFMTNRMYLDMCFSNSNEIFGFVHQCQRLRRFALLYWTVSRHLVVWRAQVVRCISLIRSLREGSRALVVREGGGPVDRRMVARPFGFCKLFLLSCVP